MVDKIVIKLVNLLQDDDLICPSDSEYYIYALITMIEGGITVSTILLIGFLCRQIIPTVCFLVFFLSLRKRTGGFHADKFWQCYLGTIATYIVIVAIADILSDKPAVMYALLLCSVLGIEIIGTVNHPNMDMDAFELSEAKKAARTIALLEFMVIVMLIWLGFSGLYVSYMSLAIILCAALLYLAKIIKQEVK